MTFLSESDSRPDTWAKHEYRESDSLKYGKGLRRLRPFRSYSLRYSNIKSFEDIYTRHNVSKIEKESFIILLWSK